MAEEEVRDLKHEKDPMWLADEGGHMESGRRNRILPTTSELGREP